MIVPKAVAIDLFGTLVHIDPALYPSVEWEGRTRLSSAPVLAERIRSWIPDLDSDRFLAVSIAVQDELEIERRIEHREIPSVERFRRTLIRAGIDPTSHDGELLRVVQRLHLDTLTAAARLPNGSLQLLATLAQRGPLVLVSNFDDGAACRRLLDARGITPFLSAVLVSEEHGWRKPHRSIFERARQEAGCAAEELLFVGDSPIDDIDGARAAGLIPVWLRGALTPPDGWTPPRWVIDELTELLDPDGPLGRAKIGQTPRQD